MKKKKKIVLNYIKPTTFCVTSSQKFELFTFSLNLEPSFSNIFLQIRFLKPQCQLEIHVLDRGKSTPKLECKPLNAYYCKIKCGQLPPIVPFIIREKFTGREKNTSPNYFLVYRSKTKKHFADQDTTEPQQVVFDHGLIQTNIYN